VPERSRPATILTGEIARAHGLGGEVIVKSYSENPERFAPGAELLVGRSPEESTPMRIESSRPHQDRLIVHLTGVEDRTQAERLRGLLLFVDTSQLPALEQGSYWEHELVGVEVVDVAGEHIGVVSAVLAREEQDLWEVSTDAGHVQIPATPDIVKSVDPAGGKIVVDLPEGMIGRE
jgi:16S rRNA processing protein RimM